MTVNQLAQQFINCIKERDNCQFNTPEWDYFNDCANATIPLVKSQDMDTFTSLINEGCKIS